MEGMYLQGLSKEEMCESFREIVSQEVEKALRKIKTEELQERYISPSEVRKMFVPAISRQTLHSWSERGYLQKHVIGRSVYYKHSEVLQAIQSIKRFERNTV